MVHVRRRALRRDGLAQARQAVQLVEHRQPKRPVRRAEVHEAAARREDGGPFARRVGGVELVVDGVLGGEGDGVEVDGVVGGIVVVDIC